MELRNPLSKFQADQLYKPLVDTLRRDLTDNSVEYLVVGDITEDREIRIEYSLELPIGGRALTGVIVLNQDGSLVDLDNHYSFTDPEIETVEWDSDIVGNNVRLIITTTGIGENPVFIYRRSVLPVA